jgi:hypothetical protein
MSASEQFKSDQQKTRGPASTAFGLVLLGASILGLVLLARALYPVDLPASTNPDFIDTIFDNRAVVWGARLLLVSGAAVLAFGGIFIVVSIGIRMKNREWLRRAGPFEISEGAVSEIQDQVEFWRQSALADQAEVAALTKRLGESADLIQNLHDTVDGG